MKQLAAPASSPALFSRRPCAPAALALALRQDPRPQRPHDPLARPHWSTRLPLAALGQASAPSALPMPQTSPSSAPAAGAALMLSQAVMHAQQQPYTASTSAPGGLPAPPATQFESVILALRLAVESLQSAPSRPDGRSPATRAVQLACALADLVAAGLPLDAAAMSAGVVAEAAAGGYLHHDLIERRLGSGVATLVHDMLRVRQAPSRIELFDDSAASAIREWCLALHDVRACAVEVLCWWDELQHSAGLQLHDQQALALEVLQVGAPLGHALGLGPVAALMEDLCLKALFPGSYAATAEWLRSVGDPAEEALFAAQRELLAALDAHPTLGQLCGGVRVKARTKSMFSVMKKLLQLSDMSRGGRSRSEVFDLLGMRAIVQPAPHLPPEEAEAAATRACYVVQEVAAKLWRPMPERTKDYVTCPKANGYQSIHMTLQLPGMRIGPDGVAHADSSAAAVPLCMEMQIRTAAMDRAAESGEAAHAVYKGGLDSRSARQLQAWTRELQQRLSTQPRGRFLLRAAAAALPGQSERVARARQRRGRSRSFSEGGDDSASAASDATAPGAGIPLALPPPGSTTSSIVALPSMPVQDTTPVPALPLQALLPPPRRGTLPPPTAAAAAQPGAYGAAAAPTPGPLQAHPPQAAGEQRSSPGYAASFSSSTPGAATSFTSIGSASFSSLSSMDLDLDLGDLTIGLAPLDAARAAEQLFRRLDRNGDGKISLGEVRQMLSDVAAAPGAHSVKDSGSTDGAASDGDAEALMSLLGANGVINGEVSLQEWVELQRQGGLRRDGYAA